MDNITYLLTKMMRLWQLSKILIAYHWSTGKAIGKFGTRGTKEGEFEFPFAVSTCKDEHILVTDYHHVQKLTYDGICVKSVGSSESGCGQLEFTNPCGITSHLDTGQIFVADQFNNRVQVFDCHLSFIRTISPQGSRERFSCPRDVALDGKGYLYVAEWPNHCITKFTLSGQFVMKFASRGSAPGQLYRPQSLAIFNNIIYVSEWDNRRISVFDTEGRFIHCFGKKGTGVGEFIRPWGIAVDTFGNLFISDIGTKRIVKY